MFDRRTWSLRVPPVCSIYWDPPGSSCHLTKGTPQQNFLSPLINGYNSGRNSIKHNFRISCSIFGEYLDPPPTIHTCISPTPLHAGLYYKFWLCCVDVLRSSQQLLKVMSSHVMPISISTVPGQA